MYKFFNKNKKTISIILFAAIVFSLLPIAGQIQTSAATDYNGYIVYNANELTKTDNTGYSLYNINLNGSVAKSYTSPIYVYVIFKCIGTANIFITASGNSTATQSINSSVFYTYKEFTLNWKLSTDYFGFQVSYTNNTTSDQFELYQIVISDTNDANVISYVETAVSNVNNIPTSDYLSFISSFHYADNNTYISSFAVNDAVVISNDIYTGSSSYFQLNGSLACTGGVSSYYASITAGETSSSVDINVATDSNERESVTNYINNNNLNISNYLNNLNFSVRIDLTNYTGQDISLLFGGYDTLRNSRSVVFVINLHCYSFNGGDDPDEPSDTETETETDIPIEDSIAYDKGYAAGYEAAAKLANNGVFQNCTLYAIYEYSTLLSPSGQFDTGISTVYFNSIPSTHSLFFNEVIEYWDKNYNDTVYIDYTLLNVLIVIDFESPFRYQRDLMYLQGLMLTDFSNYNVPIITLYDQDYIAHDTALTIFSNRTYIPINSKNDYTGLVSSIHIEITNQSSIRYWLDDYDMRLYIPPFDIIKDLAAYNRGVAIGKEDGAKLGFDQGYKEGLKAPTDKAFSDGRTEGYEEGFKAGVLEEQSNELRQEFKFYDLFFSIFDSMSNVFQSIASFEIFGVNVAGFVFGLVTIGVIAFVIRKVW